MTEIVIVAAKRTPIGKFLGSLSGFSSPELGSLVIDSTIKQSGIEKKKINKIIFGQV